MLPSPAADVIAHDKPNFIPSSGQRERALEYFLPCTLPFERASGDRVAFMVGCIGSWIALFAPVVATTARTTTQSARTSA